MRKLTTPAWAVLILLFLSLLENGKSATPDPLDSWEQDYPFSVSAVLYARDRFWLGTDLGVFSSPDAQTWRKKLATPGSVAGPMAYGNGLLLVSSGSQIFVTADGEKWTQAPAQPGFLPGRISGLAFGNGRFVASSRNLHSSEDGLHWQATITNAAWGSPSFVDGQFVIFGAFEELTSTDGLHWTHVPLSATNPISDVGYLARGPGGVIGLGSDGFYSLNSNRVTLMTKILQAHFLDLEYFGGQFIASGYQGTSGVIAVSLDGFSWGPNTKVTGWADYVGYGEGKYVAAGFDTIVSSPDGLHWKNERVPGEITWSIAGNSNILIAAGSTNPKPPHENTNPHGSFLMSTHDGSGWKWVDSATTNSFRSIIFDGEKFVAVGERGRAATSTDGELWIEHPTSIQIDLASLAFAQNIYIACGFSADSLQSALLRSDDGEHWRVLGSPAVTPIRPEGLRGQAIGGTAPLFRGVAAGPERFVAIGTYADTTSGFAAVSTDGENWATFSTFARLGSIAYGNGIFVACGTEGAIGVSTNGEVWQISSIDDALLLPNVTFAGGVFLTSDGAQIWTSKDGRLWRPHPIPSRSFGALQAFAFWNRTWYAAGQQSLLWHSRTLGPQLSIFSPAGQRPAHIRVEDDLSGAVTLERSFDLETWVTVTNSAVTPFELDNTPANAEKAFYRARIRGN